MILSKTETFKKGLKVQTRYLRLFTLLVHYYNRIIDIDLLYFLHLMLVLMFQSNSPKINLQSRRKDVLFATMTYTEQKMFSFSNITSKINNMLK